MVVFAVVAAWGSFDAPMGGMKDSGVGRRHGDAGLLKYTEPQTIALQRLAPVALTADHVARPGVRRIGVWLLKAMHRFPGVR